MSFEALLSMMLRTLDSEDARDMLHAYRAAGGPPMLLGLYRLVDRVPVPEPDGEAWSLWFATHHEERVVAQTDVRDGALEVSTTFTGRDAHLGIEDCPYGPLVFETMLFQTVETHHLALRRAELLHRYHTWAEAVEGHQQIVEFLEARETQTLIDNDVTCTACGATDLETWYTGQRWGETLCEACYEAREAAGQARETLPEPD